MVLEDEIKARNGLILTEAVLLMLQLGQDTPNVNGAWQHSGSQQERTLMGSQEEGPVRIAIIGGGVAGLTAAYELAGDGDAEVHIFENGPELGGLASGFKGRESWEWPLEKFYHHLFTNDYDILRLTERIGADDLLQIHRPSTVMHFQGGNYPLDSPAHLLRFPHLSLPEKLRMGLVLAYLKYHPRPPWRVFDRLVADEWLARWMGETAYGKLWQPMLEGKFGPFFEEVNLAWFWARVYKRTPRLGYYQGGFQAFVDRLGSATRERGVTIETNAPVRSVSPLPEGGFRIETGEKGEAGESPAARDFDVVLATVSPGLMQRLVPALPGSYLAQLGSLRHMGAVVMTVALDRPLLKDTYWVNVPKAEGLPFLVLVEHTNMIDPGHYGGDHLLYLGDYLEPSHRYFSMSQEELLAEFLPALPRFNREFRPEWVTGAWLHRATYAQPVPVRGYAEMIPDLRTPLRGLYFASMSQVYPWDRGTNYAVEIGQRAAGMIVEDSS